MITRNLLSTKYCTITYTSYAKPYWAQFSHTHRIDNLFPINKTIRLEWKHANTYKYMFVSWRALKIPICQNYTFFFKFTTSGLVFTFFCSRRCFDIFYVISKHESFSFKTWKFVKHCRCCYLQLNNSSYFFSWIR